MPALASGWTIWWPRSCLPRAGVHGQADHARYAAAARAVEGDAALTNPHIKPSLEEAPKNSARPT
jgi:hypothetical protein